MPTNILNVLITWIPGLRRFLAPPLAKDEQGRIASDNATARKHSSAGDGSNKPPKKFFLPNTVGTWPWPRRLNQHYTEINAESSAWIKSFKAFTPKAQEGYDRCQFGKTRCMI